MVTKNSLMFAQGNLANNRSLNNLTDCAQGKGINLANASLHVDQNGYFTIKYLYGIRLGTRR
jgi:hypothetical protein